MRAVVLLLLLAACKHSTPDRDGPPDVTGREHPFDAAVDAATAERLADSAVEKRPVGPFEVPFEGERKVFYAIPPTKAPARLIANLHGVCNPPGYACGFWVPAGSSHGFLLCPEGNGHCGGKSGPPTWTEPLARMDEDLERAIAAVDARYPGEIDRQGAVLTGFSLGAYSAYGVAKAHPGRWPLLVLVEADVALDEAALRKAGVRAVAMLAGELGSQLAGEAVTVKRLSARGFPARLWVMKGAGHFYSADIDALMREALDYVIAEGADAGR